MFRLNNLLRSSGIDPQRTVILLHTPGERKLARLLPFLAAEEPLVLEAYQSVHSRPATATMRQRDTIISFIRTETGRLALAGVFANRGVADRPTSELRAIPHMRRVIDEFGANSVLDDPTIKTWPYFTLVRLPQLSEYVGRLQIAPRLTQTYARLAEKLDAEIVELAAESVFVPPAPNWREFIVTGPEVRSLPRSWQVLLKEWRGIYLITDEADGQRYVGAAYGQENLLGRWIAHVAKDKGVTVQLRLRDPLSFRFSIIERVSPDMPAEDVIRLERTWMERLDTIQYGLNT
jgi:hypothetical protein